MMKSLETVKEAEADPSAVLLEADPSAVLLEAERSAVLLEVNSAVCKYNAGALTTLLSK